MCSLDTGAWTVGRSSVETVTHGPLTPQKVIALGLTQLQEIRTTASPAQNRFGVS